MVSSSLCESLSITHCVACSEHSTAAATCYRSAPLVPPCRCPAPRPSPVILTLSSSVRPASLLALSLLAWAPSLSSALRTSSSRSGSLAPRQDLVLALGLLNSGPVTYATPACATTCAAMVNAAAVSLPCSLALDLWSDSSLLARRHGFGFSFRMCAGMSQARWVPAWLGSPDLEG